jgi:hypothetical protein
MPVTNLTTSLADRYMPVDPSFEPATPSSSNAAREARMVQEGLSRYHTRQQKLAERGRAKIPASAEVYFEDRGNFRLARGRHLRGMFSGRSSRSPPTLIAVFDSPQR